MICKIMMNLKARIIMYASTGMSTARRSGVDMGRTEDLKSLVIARIIIVRKHEHGSAKRS